MLIIDKIVALFRYSEESPEVKALLVEMGFPPNATSKRIQEKIYVHNQLNVSLVFITKNNFEFDYGACQEIYTTNYSEAFLQAISFGNAKEKANFVGPLPYNLFFNQNLTDVKKLLRQRPSNKFTFDGNTSVQFHTSDHELAMTFDAENRLSLLRIGLNSTSYTKKRNLKFLINKQNQNLSPDRLYKLMADKKNNFLNTQLDESEVFFPANKKYRSELNATFHRFLDHLCIATRDKKALVIYSAVKKVVLALNKLNVKYAYFIETAERETLIKCINHLLLLTGFQLDDNLDITEEWRDW